MLVTKINALNEVYNKVKGRKSRHCLTYYDLYLEVNFLV